MDRGLGGDGTCLDLSSGDPEAATVYPRRSPERGRARFHSPRVAMIRIPTKARAGLESSLKALGLSEEWLFPDPETAARLAVDEARHEQFPPAETFAIY